MTLAYISVRILETYCSCLPLFCAPQTSQVRYVLRLVFVSSKLPQSVQNTRDPMAAMIVSEGWCSHVRECCVVGERSRL